MVIQPSVSTPMVNCLRAAHALAQPTDGEERTFVQEKEGRRQACLMVTSMRKGGLARMVDGPTRALLNQL